MIKQTIGVYLAPLMTPVLCRSRAERPVPEDEDEDEDEDPWRHPAVRPT
jgi:hypothetical protein